jgi:hypothetical protein
MRRQSRYLVGGLGAAIAVLSFAVCLEVTVATARPGVEPPGVQRIPFNRALKGDRLRPMSYPDAAPTRRMMDGCESSFSSIRRPLAGEMPGRCIAAVPAWHSVELG